MMPSFNYGGQAVLEGVMMRGERDWAAAVRDPNGHIVVRREPLTAAVYRSRFLKLPFVRGLTLLWDSLGLGLSALIWSADVALEEEGESLSGPLAWGTMALSLGFGVGLFILLPAFLTGLVDRYVASGLASNLIEGGIRLALLVGYMAAIGTMPDIRRVFAYHGAEHKTINAYEGGSELTPEAVSAYPREHTRCGTGFLLGVVVIMVFLSTLLGRPPLLVRLLTRVLLIPVVAGIAYELLKLNARLYDKSAVVRIITAPGLALQRLTTREPDAGMLEVAITALKAVLASEGLLAATDAALPVSEQPESVTVSTTKES
ncbi:MAG: DUF1385 domain-containing protein [Anaerolineae bacterium]|nr:DUF1385 domain-containing protein [Anaerolineae bacterium]